MQSINSSRATVNANSVKFGFNRAKFNSINLNKAFCLGANSVAYNRSIRTILCSKKYNQQYNLM